jgi:hypothetical protein
VPTREVELVYANAPHPYVPTGDTANDMVEIMGAKGECSAAPPGEGREDVTPVLIE